MMYVARVVLCLVLLLFVRLAFAFVPASTDILGTINVVITCRPGASLWFNPNGGDYWISDGSCPASGTTTCGRNQPNARYGAYYINQDYTVGFCYQDKAAVAGSAPAPAPVCPAASAPAPAASSAGSCAIPLTLEPAQRADMYTALFSIFGLCLGVLGVVWGLRQVVAWLQWRGADHD